MSTPAQPQPAWHTLEPTTRFTSRVENYVKYRPTYPSEAITEVLRGLGSPERLVVCDIGAGTGISSRQLGDCGCRVIAIEPNEAMRLAAAAHPRVEYRAGTAEATGLPDAHVDVVVCAQAFHWFRPVEALADFARVLREGGRVALMWNDRDITTPAGAEYERLTQQASTAPRSVSWTGYQRPLRESMLFRNFREYECTSEQRLTLDGLIGRALSASYVPTSGRAHDALLQGLAEMHRRHAESAGIVVLPQRTSVYLAEKR